MAKSAKATAVMSNPSELEAASLTATELSNEVPTVDPYVGVGHRGDESKLTLLRADEITERDMLIRREVLESDNEIIQSGKWFHFLTRKVRRVFRTMIISGAVMLPLGFLIVPIFGTEGALVHVAGATSAVGEVLFMVGGALNLTAPNDFLKSKGKMLKYAIEVPNHKLARVSGERYEMNTPSYDELYEAFELLNLVNKAHYLSTDSAKELSELVSVRKSKGTLERIEYLKNRVSEQKRLINDYEARITELLASNGDEVKPHQESITKEGAHE